MSLTTETRFRWNTLVLAYVNTRVRETACFTDVYVLAVVSLYLHEIKQKQTNEACNNLNAGDCKEVKRLQKYAPELVLHGRETFDSLVCSSTDESDKIRAQMTLEIRRQIRLWYYARSVTYTWTAHKETSNRTERAAGESTCVHEHTQ